MKRFTIILVMLLMAATSFNQSSRRTANNTGTAADERKKSSAEARTSINRTNTAARRQSDKDVNNKTAYKNTVQTRRTSYNNSANNNSSNNNSANNTVKRDRSTINTSVRRTSNGNRNYSYSGNKTGTVNNIDAKTVNTASRRTVNVNRSTNNYTSSRKYVHTRPVKYAYHYPVHSREYRARVYPYRKPLSVNIYWTNSMRYSYYRWYPSIKYWYYPIGYRIHTISAYNALYYTGEVMNVYGKVYEVFYSETTDEYYMYFGAYYPYHDFTVVIPGWIARRYSHRPVRFFEREHMVVTGLITSYNREPEIVVKSPNQISIY
jgi:hypothetical protein